MYESFFGLSARPFVAAPLVESYFPGESIEQARQTLTRAIDRAEGPGLLVGPSGVGKTLLCRVLADHFSDTFQVAMLASTRIITRKSLLQNILFELGLPYRELEEGELRLLLLDHLQPHADCPHGVLLLVDEAHTLSFRLLEEIRLITNLVRDGQPRVRLVLAGGPKLDERFTNPKLDSFNQRIAARCYLSAFNREDTLQYVRARIAAVGARADSVFAADALQAVYQATDGIPRLINQVCDHALVMAFAGGQRQLDRAGVEEAWADLQQLPGPWQAKAATNSAIEFGNLEGEQTFSSLASAATDSELGWGEPSAFDVMSHDPSCPEGFAWPAVDELPDLEARRRPHLNEAPAALAGNPFGDDFDEEEVVIDALAARELEFLAGRPQVQSREGSDLAETLTNSGRHVSPDQDHTSSEHKPRTEFGEQTLAAAGAGHAEGRDSAEPEFLSQMFEYTVFEPHRAPDLALEALCEVNLAIDNLQQLQGDAQQPPTVRLADHQPEPTDDRDLIIIEDEVSNEETFAEADFPADHNERLEYQQLFSQLRHG